VHEVERELEAEGLVNAAERRFIVGVVEHIQDHGVGGYVFGAYMMFPSLRTCQYVISKYERGKIMDEYVQTGHQRAG